MGVALDCHVCRKQCDLYREYGTGGREPGELCSAEKRNYGFFTQIFILNFLNLTLKFAFAGKKKTFWNLEDFGET